MFAYKRHVFETKKLKAEIEELKGEVVKLTSRCKDMNHARNGTVPLRRSSRMHKSMDETRPFPINRVIGHRCYDRARAFIELSCRNLIVTKIR
jgi:hypothetical protein